MFVVKYRKIFYTLSILLVLFSIFSIAKFGLNYGIDFKGGSIVEVEYSGGARPDKEVVQELVKNAGVSSEMIVRPTGDTGFIIRTESLSSTTISTITAALTGTSTASSTVVAKIKRFDTVGPILGQELQSKAWSSIVLVIIAIVLFITFVFRQVSKPVSSWKYGLAAIVALAHDVLVPTGIYVFLGRNGGYEIDALFVTAILVILGFSVHDTIVVFDRTRENLRHDENHRKSFDKIVGESISQTFTRSINTSMTTILAVLALFLFGAEATRNFSLILIIGLVLGTYSSIFLGSPLLVTFWKWQERKVGKK